MSKFKVVVALEDNGSFESFGEAFKVLFEKVMKLVAESTSFQVLETACWIEYAGTKMYFYDTRDLAYRVGVLKGKGELVDPLPKIDSFVVDLAFFEKVLDTIEEYEDEVIETLQQAFTKS